MSNRSKSVRPIIRLPNTVWPILLLAVIIAWSPSLVGAEFQISLLGGSVITVKVDQASFRWTNVLANGEMTEEQVEFSEIEQLALSDSPASEQVAEVRRLLSLLESPDYLERQMAEEQLSDSEIAGTFQSIIKAQSEHPNYEVRYRVGRILDKLESGDADGTRSEFDQLILKDGTRKKGDAGDFKLNCRYRNLNLSFARKDLNLISVPVSLAAVESDNALVQVKMFHDHAGNFFQPGQTTIEFETAPNGVELARNTDVSETFTPFGLRLGTEQVGYVGISGYGFKFSLPPKSNSICVFETLGTYNKPKRFKGVMEMSFCLPNRKSVPAGVNEFGLFMARVLHSRDFIMEAYNAAGQILATVESTDQACVFAGVKSNELIARVRVLSNPYLFRLDRNIDEDYAVDNICFSQPVPIKTSRGEGKAILRLRNGDLIQGNAISIVDPDSISIEMSDGDPITVALFEIESVRFNVAQSDGDNQDNQWMAMLNDRSTLIVEPGKTFASTMFPHLKFRPEELLGFWSSRNSARFPEATDFASGKQVMVFPTCRIATDQVEFLNTGYRWKKSAKKIEQPLNTRDEKDDEDPTPDINSVDYETSWPENVPTIWTNPPKTPRAGTGRLELVDGQQLTLGINSGFSMEKLDKRTATVSIAGRKTKIPIEQIISIEFPKTEPKSQD